MREIIVREHSPHKAKERIIEIYTKLYYGKEDRDLARFLEEVYLPDLDIAGTVMVYRDLFREITGEEGYYVRS